MSDGGYFLTADVDMSCMIALRRSQLGLCTVQCTRRAGGGAINSDKAAESRLHMSRQPVSSCDADAVQEM